METLRPLAAWPRAIVATREAMTTTLIGALSMGVATALGAWSGSLLGGAVGAVIGAPTGLLAWLASYTAWGARPAAGKHHWRCWIDRVWDSQPVIGFRLDLIKGPVGASNVRCIVTAPGNKTAVAQWAGAFVAERPGAMVFRGFSYPDDFQGSTAAEAGTREFRLLRCKVTLSPQETGV